MIEQNGYRYQVHRVVTEDDYSLNLHRIMVDTKNMDPSVHYHETPVLLHHGFLSSSADFVMNDPDKALAYMLADAGYDVWLANSRGNVYSREHLTLDVDSEEDATYYWDFSLDEIAKYDLPAQIDYVLDMSRRTSLHYIGFSMGTTVFYSMLNYKPHYNRKIRLMTSLAPTAYMGNVKGTSRVVSTVVGAFVSMFSSKESFEILRNGGTFHRLLVDRCSDKDSLVTGSCRAVLSSIGGPGVEEFDERYLKRALMQLPAGTSIHTFLHFAQLIRSGKFSMYDRGALMNQRDYGTEVPPTYNVDNVAVPVAVFYGTNDYLSNSKDVKQLIEKLPNVVFQKQLSYNHFSFIWGKSAVSLVYEPILSLLEKY